jgi:hypothetical protein
MRVGYTKLLIQARRRSKAPYRLADITFPQAGQGNTFFGRSFVHSRASPSRHPQRANIILERIPSFIVLQRKTTTAQQHVYKTVKFSRVQQQSPSTQESIPSLFEVTFRFVNQTDCGEHIRLTDPAFKSNK